MTAHEPPTLEGRAMLDLERQLVEERARRERAEAARDAFAADIDGLRKAYDDLQLELHRVAQQYGARADAALSALDSRDCTYREGGDTRHCRTDRPCLRCERDTAVNLMLAFIERADDLPLPIGCASPLERMSEFVVAALRRAGEGA